MREVGERLPTPLSAALALAAAGASLAARALRARRAALVLALSVALCALAQLLQLASGWQPALVLLKAPTPRVNLCLLLVALALLLGHLRPRPSARLAIGVSGSAVAILACASLLDLGGDFQLGEVYYHRLQTSYLAGSALLLLGIGGVLGGWEAGSQDPQSTLERRIALGAGIAITVAFCVLWQLMLSQDERQLQDRVHANSRRVRLEIETELTRSLIAPLRRTANRWASRDRFQRGQRDLQGAALHADLPSLTALALLRPGGELGWCFPPDRGESFRPFLTPDSPARAALEAAEQRQEAQLSPLFASPEASTSFWIVIPVPGSGEFLVGTCDYAAFLKPHQERQLAFGFGLSSPRADARSPSEAVEPAPPAKGAIDAQIALAGAAWTLRVWPTPARVQAGSSSLPEISLVLGLGLAALAAALVHLALNERRRGLEALATTERLAREMSERQRVERRLAEQAQRLEETARALTKSNRDLEEFAYVAAHDLKSPLRAIHSLSEWIEEDLGERLEGEAAENMTLLRARVKRMEQLLDSLLQYSRAGRTAHDVKRIDTHQMVTDAWDLLGPPEGFVLEIEGELPTFRAAEAPLEQILRNLLANAVKHHDKPEGTVRVAARPEPPGRWTFSVSDDGPGIAPAFHERVFGMFKTLKSRDRVEGSGMGLALVQRLVHRYAGQIEVISAGDEARGATFRFDWPAEPEAGSAG